MDLLGDVLGSLNVFSHSIGLFKLGPNVHLHLQRFPANFTYVFTNISGDFWIEVEGCEARQLNEGDSILIFGGRAHNFGVSLDNQQASFEDVWFLNDLPKFGETRNKPICLEVGSFEDGVTLLALGFTVDEPTQHSLLKLLPPYLLITSGSPLDIWTKAAHTFCDRELEQNTPGFSATAMHITHLIFSEFIRSYLNSSDSIKMSWMKGLSDNRIGKALAIMHMRSEEAWTVALIADEVNMSRSTFARTFKGLVGQSPVSYLTGCRMQKAAQYLLEGNLPIGELTELLGYGSERAFRNAFVQHFGLSPSHYRKQQRKI